MKSKVFFFILVLTILILAVIPRVIEVLNGNYVFGFDQGKHWLAAKSIVVDKKMTLIGDEVGGKGGFFQGSGWFYTLAIPFIFFSGDPYGGVVLMFLLSLGVVAFSMLFFHSFLGLSGAVFIGILISVSPTLIAQARFVWPPFVIPILSVSYFYCVYKLCKKQFTFVIPVFFIIGLMAHFEIATAGTLFFSTVLLFSLYLLIIKKSFLWLIKGCVSFAIPLLPLFIFDLKHQFLNTKGIIRTIFSFQSNAPIGSGVTIGNHLQVYLSELFGSFSYIPISKIFFAICILVGVLFFLKDKKTENGIKRFLLYLTILPIFLFGVILCYRNAIWGWWFLEMQVAILYLVGLLLTLLWKRFLLGKIACVIFVYFFISAYMSNIGYMYGQELYDYGGTQKIRGKIEALDIIYKDAEVLNFGLLVFTPPVYTYPYDYLLWWYGGKKYGYVPPREKKKTFYVLIEPDGGKPWTYKGWLETVVKDGVVEKTWELPSGFIIEKRKTL